PGYWPEDEDGPVNGVFWFRKSVEIPPHLHGQPADLDLGRIVAADTAYVNGVHVGNTTYQYPPRRYAVPAGILQTGENIIAIRVTSQQGRGGFFLDKPYELRIGQERFDLKGDWHYRVGATMPPLESPTFVRWKPQGLFNAKISPLLNYGIRGVIWYQ